MVGPQCVMIIITKSVKVFKIKSFIPGSVKTGNKYKKNVTEYYLICQLKIVKVTLCLMDD